MDLRRSNAISGLRKTPVLLPLPMGLAAMLDSYVSERRARLLGDCGASNNVISFRRQVDAAPLFDMAATMVHVFDDDLNAAGISKTDAQGRVLDIHAWRHSFCTMVAQSGVTMQHAQRLMRHNTPANDHAIHALDLDRLGRRNGNTSGLAGNLTTRDCAGGGKRIKSASTVCVHFKWTRCNFVHY